MIKISAVIPIYAPHFILLDSLLQDISKQTYQPYEVIISASQYNNITKPVFDTIVEKYKNILNIMVITTPETRLAGINRNYGAEVATGELVSFFDADDKYHPQRLEILKLLYEKYNYDIILHSYYGDDVKYTEFSTNVDDMEVISKDILFEKSFGNPPVRDISSDYRGFLQGKLIPAPFKVSHGVVTVKRSIFDKHKYINLKLGEDAVFCRDLLWYGYNLMCVNLNLYTYEKAVTEKKQIKYRQRFMNSFIM